MREILFRGKINSERFPFYNGEWIQGSLIKHECQVSGWLHEDFYWINADNYDRGGRDEYLVDPNTIGQYTGLTDKNGVKIFEGDIVALPRYDGTQDARVVIYNPARARFVRRSLNNLINEVDEYVMNRGCCKGYEVIGNIHDNPELVEVGK